MPNEDSPSRYRIIQIELSSNLESNSSIHFQYLLIKTFMTYVLDLLTLYGRSLLDIASGPEVWPNFKVWAVQKLYIFLPRPRTFNGTKIIEKATKNFLKIFLRSFSLDTNLCPVAFSSENS